MLPRHARAVVAIEVLFGDPPVTQEIGVLLGAGDGREDVEGSDVGRKITQRRKVIEIPFSVSGGNPRFREWLVIRFSRQSATIFA